MTNEIEVFGILTPLGLKKWKKHTIFIKINQYLPRFIRLIHGRCFNSASSFHYSSLCYTRGSIAHRRWADLFCELTPNDHHTSFDEMMPHLNPDEEDQDFDPFRWVISLCVVWTWLAQSFYQRFVSSFQSDKQLKITRTVRRPHTSTDNPWRSLLHLTFPWTAKSNKPPPTSLMSWCLDALMLPILE